LLGRIISSEVKADLGDTGLVVSVRDYSGLNRGELPRGDKKEALPLTLELEPGELRERPQSAQWVLQVASDSDRAAPADEQAFSWWDYRGGAFHRDQGLRIDLMLSTPSLIGRVRGVEIDREYRNKKDGLTASDHAPVIVDLD
jgi:hypothetical protein